MASARGWFEQLGPRLRAVRGGLHPASALKIVAGRHDDVRLCGVRLGGASPRGVANTAVEVAAGEYRAPGFGPGGGERVVDGGANVGAFAIVAAVAGAEVIAYEPDPVTFAYLERNVAGLAVTCVQAALVGAAAAGDRVRLAVDPRSSTASRVATDGSVEVPAVALADAIGGGCDLLKLDCEGAEAQLLTDTPDAALRRARRVACEVHPWADASAEQLADRLRGLGFAVQVVPKRNGLALVFARSG